MREYHKIQTVFKRDPETNHKTLLIGEFSEVEFGYLATNEWTFTEKVDGTNIRVISDLDGIRFGGKTDSALIPTFLVERLQSRFMPQAKRLAEFFPDGACLYGEGYGARIQKGGGNYRPDADFVLFDINVCGSWLSRNDIEGIASALGIEVVPIIGRGTLKTMVDMAAAGFASRWGDFSAEGIVARPAVELHTSSGKRIITKIKYRDFASRPMPSQSSDASSDRSTDDRLDHLAHQNHELQTSLGEVFHLLHHIDRKTNLMSDIKSAIADLQGDISRLVTDVRQILAKQGTAIEQGDLDALAKLHTDFSAPLDAMEAVLMPGSGSGSGEGSSSTTA